MKFTDINQDYRSKFGYFRLFYYIKAKILNIFNKKTKMEEEMNSNMTTTTILPEIEIAIEIPDIQLTKNFKRSEFDTNDGTIVPGKYMKKLQKLANNLQILRNYLGKPIIIISGYRYPAYNKKAKGARFSKHKKAMAGDIRIRGLSSVAVHNAILYLIKDKQMKQGGLGLYDFFVHYDTRLIRARWDKRKRS